VPAWFLDNANLKDYPVLDGIFAWDGSWPRADVKTNWEYDDQRSAAIGDGKIYMAAASPWFFAHYASKNWFYGGDDWLFNTRWEQLIAHRDRVDIVEIISWNGQRPPCCVSPPG
jgi:glucan endo-1,3-alpha-glucosidase